MKAHVRNTVRNVLRRDRSRSQSRSGAPVGSNSPLQNNDTSSSSRVLERDEDLTSSQQQQQARHTHRFPPFRSFSRAPSPQSGTSRSKTFRWGHHQDVDDRSGTGSMNASEEAASTSTYRRNSFFSAHRWRSQGRDSDAESTDHESHRQRWPRRIFSKMRRNKSTSSRAGVEDSGASGNESERDPEVSSSSWRARFSRRKSRPIYPQSNQISGNKEIDSSQQSNNLYPFTPQRESSNHEQQSQNVMPHAPFSPSRSSRYRAPTDSRHSNSMSSSSTPMPDGSYTYISPSGAQHSFKTSNSSVYIRPSDNFSKEGGAYHPVECQQQQPPEDHEHGNGSRQYYHYVSSHNGPTRKLYREQGVNYIHTSGSIMKEGSPTKGGVSSLRPATSSTHSSTGRQIDPVANNALIKSSGRIASRHHVGAMGVINNTLDPGQQKKRYQAGWSPQDTLTPGTESTRATELDSPYQDDPGLSNETDCHALTYSPEDSPASPIVVHANRSKNDVQQNNNYYSQQKYDTSDHQSIDNSKAVSTNRTKLDMDNSWTNHSLVEISCPSWALTVHGTPVDLTQFFCPKVWTPERYKSLKRLAPAIHGEVRYVLDLLEKKSVVVKVIRNSAVRPRSPGELENPLVEIGAMTYLHSNKAAYPVDLIAELVDVYQDSKYTYLVTEYCSEGELFREVVARKCLSERHVKAIALQLTIALYSLHKNGICHRDVSLENTLLQADRSVRLIDFGQAETIHEPDGRPKYMTGSAGKAYYRAPEMLRGSYLGPPVDVFALGVEIFIMAVGSPPWQKASLQDARYRNLTKCSTALDVALRKWGKRAHLSDAFVDILASIFCSEPNMRPTIEDLLYHPWFAFDSGVWRWVYARGCSKTIRSHAERVEKYLRLHPQGKYFARPCISSIVSNTDRTPSEVQ